jgi:hypothetical protein
MKPIVEIKEHGAFTDQDLQTAKTLLNKEAHPHLYPKKAGDNKDLPSLKYIDTIIIPSEAIQRNTTLGHEQPVRSYGANPEKPKLKQDIEETGWRLYCIPIAVREVDGDYYLMDGRPKDDILLDKKVKNRIVNVYTCDDGDALLSGLDLNLTQPPAGIAKEIDIIDAAHYAIKEGLLAVDEEEILEVTEGTSDRDIAQVLADLETEMLEAADELQFEKAAQLRDQIEALRTGKPATAKKRPKSRR